jgi:hypothetical protein
MMYRIFFLVFILLTSCKEDEDDKPAVLYDITVTVTGMVTDQAGQPLADATVSSGIDFVYKPIVYNKSTLTGPDGKFALRTQVGTYTGHISPGTLMGKWINFVASKSGYSGSNIHRYFYYYGAPPRGLNFQLYRNAELSLHVRNDTINNNIDAVEIRLKKYPDPEVVFFQSCNQRKLDSTFIIKNLCGNCEYSIQVLKPGGQAFSPAISYTITPKPDIINFFEISF